MIRRFRMSTYPRVARRYLHCIKKFFFPRWIAISYSDDLETGTVTSQPWDKKSSMARNSPMSPRVSVEGIVCVGPSHYRPSICGPPGGGICRFLYIQESICAPILVSEHMSMPDPVRLAHRRSNDISDLDVTPSPLFLGLFKPPSVSNGLRDYVQFCSF